MPFDPEMLAQSQAEPEVINIQEVQVEVVLDERLEDAASEDGPEGLLQ